MQKSMYCFDQNVSKTKQTLTATLAKRSFPGLYNICIPMYDRNERKKSRKILSEGALKISLEKKVRENEAA